jgi:hemolysin III
MNRTHVSRLNETARQTLQHRREELANAMTLGLGVLASVAATVGLVMLAVRSGDAWDIVGISIFGSTLYHGARSLLAKARLEILDHSAIYLLIAGTYTPFMIGTLRGAWGWSLFGVIWGLAVLGVGFKLLFTGRFRLFSTGVYVGMGWLALIAAGPMVRMLSPAALLWLVLGGLAYTAGTPFYHSTRIRYAHALWHIFVLAGSGCHVLAVALQI